jgi:large subunit ribosomal protein L3
MPGIIGKKIGMTSIFDQNNNSVACTVVEAGPCPVTQIKTEATDGYNAVQIGFGQKKEKNTTKALQGHFNNAGVEPVSLLKEFDFNPEEFTLGQEVTVEMFSEGQLISVVGTSKGKGFQGVVKRHNFRGNGDQTHGQHDQERMPGSVGGASDPSRVFKGIKMGGQMGGRRVKVRDLMVMKIIPERNVIVVEGSIPGAKGSYVYLEDKVK